jgi:capsular polysaccharide transport system permease protein
MTDNTLMKSFKIQLRVVNALLMREIITRYGRHNIGFLWLFVEPMMFTLGVMALWTAAKMDHGSSIPIVAFAITGYSSVLLWRNSASRCSKAIEPNLSLMYHRNVKVLDIFSSRLILEIMGATFSLIVLTLFFASIGWMELPNDIFLVIQAWMLLVWFSIGLGLIVGALSERSEVFERIWHVATYLLFPLSGAGFMVDWLPRTAQNVLLWVPMVHGTEMIRHGFFGTMIPTYEDPLYFAMINFILTLIGLAMVRETGLRVDPE